MVTHLPALPARVMPQCCCTQVGLQQNPKSTSAKINSQLGSPVAPSYSLTKKMQALCNKTTINSDGWMKTDRGKPAGLLRGGG